jgi:hypothetical protein
VLTKTYKDIENIKVIKTHKNGGYSYGNNQGILAANEIANFKYFCIMNPDVIIEDNYFEYLCNQLSKNPNYAVISPLMIYPDNLDLTKISWDMRTPKEIYKYHFLLNKKKNKVYRAKYKYVGNSMIEADAVPGSCFIVDSDMFRQIGYFDDKCFLYNEETIMALKFRTIDKKYLISLKHHFIHNHIYVKPPEEVWDMYKNNFNTVLNNYKITYNSREYLCREYYDGKYLGRLKVIHAINIMLLYAKHFIAKIIH